MLCACGRSNTVKESLKEKTLTLTPHPYPLTPETYYFGSEARKNNHFVNITQPYP